MSTILPNTSPAAIFWWASAACSKGSTSYTTLRNSPRPAAANSSAIAARRSASVTVAALKVANDIDFWNAANISMPKSAGGSAATAPTATMRPFGLSLAKNEAMAGCNVDDDVIARGGVLASLPIAVEHVGRAEPAQAIGALSRRCRDRHRACAPARRELDRHDPDAAGRAAHQDRLAGSETAMAEAEVGHRPGAAERHRVSSRQARREGDESRGRGDRLLRVAAARAGECPHALADPGGVDAVADRGHGAGDLAAEDMTFPEAVGGEATAEDHDVDAADADRLSRDQHVQAGGRRVGEIDDRQAFGASERLDRNCLHCRLHTLGAGRD